MSRLEKLFQKVINDETISTTFDIDPSKYPSIDYAKRSLNPQVKAIVETLLLLDKKIAEEKSEMTELEFEIVTEVKVEEVKEDTSTQE